MGEFDNLHRVIGMVDSLLDKQIERGKKRQEQIARRPRPESFQQVAPPLPAETWCRNDRFVAGYPWGWLETTPAELPIEGLPPVLVLRRETEVTPSQDLDSRAVIRCFPMSKASLEDFLDMAPALPEARARALQATAVGPLQFVGTDGAPGYILQLEGTLDISAFKRVPSAITETYLFHRGEILLMQLESDPQHHLGFQQVVATVLGTLRWL